MTAHKRTAVVIIPTAKNWEQAEFLRRRQQYSSSFVCHQGQVAKAVAGIIPPAQKLRTGGVSRRVVLKIDDGLLTKVDEQLPFTGHIVRTFKQIDFI